MGDLEQILKVLASVKNARSTVWINRHQCERLAKVYDEIGLCLNAFIKENVHKTNNKMFLAFEPLLEAMEVGMYLISEYNGPNWFQNLLTSGDNIEAFREIHDELHLWAEHVLGIDLNQELDDDDTDAMRDREEMIQMLFTIKEEQMQEEATVSTSSVGRDQKVRIPYSSLNIAIHKLLPQSDANEKEEILKAKVEEWLVPRGGTFFCYEPHVNHVVKPLFPPHHILSWLEIPSSRIEVLPDVLGAGNSATVKKANWDNCTKVAVKIFEMRNKEVLEKELLQHQKLPHPHIVQLYGYSQDMESCMIVMELMDFNLRELIQEKYQWSLHARGSPFKILQALDLMLDIARAMAVVHAKDICHGDLKTPNVLGKVMGPKRYFLKLADFGESKHQDNSIPEARFSGRTGTSFFRAPEVLQNNVNYTLKVDVYSFGMISYEILTGLEPFQLEISKKSIKRKDLENQVIEEQKRPDLPGHIPIGLKTFLRSCWTHFEHNRPSFDDIILVLQKAKTDIATKPPRKVKDLWRKCHSR